MKIRVASMWLDESAIAPHFLAHYAWADEIVVLLDDATTDDSAAICRKFAATVIPHHFDRGLDDVIKSDRLTRAASWPGADWIFLVDADEIVFPAGGENARSFLSRQSADVVWSPMWQIYRHRTESTLDPAAPPAPQRRHGPRAVHHEKPVAFRQSAIISKGISLAPGGHGYDADTGSIVFESEETLLGVHWARADVDIAVRRHAVRAARLSPENLRRNHGTHYISFTEESIRAECAAHLDAPQLF